MTYVPDLGSVIDTPTFVPISWMLKLPAGWDPCANQKHSMVRVTFSGPESGRFAALVTPPKAYLLNGNERAKPVPVPRSYDGFSFVHRAGRTPFIAQDGTKSNLDDQNTWIPSSFVVGQRSHVNKDVDPLATFDAYANTAARVARVRYVEIPYKDGYALYALGAVCPGMTVAEGIDVMAGSLSGDWRYIKTRAEYLFIAAQTVSIPGFRPDGEFDTLENTQFTIAASAGNQDLAVRPVRRVIKRLVLP